MEKYSSNGKIKTFDNEFFIQQMHECKIYPDHGKENQVSLHTFLRNQIHHRKENGVASVENLKESIKKMRTYL